MATVAQKVRNLYKALLGREPDKEGLRYWVNVARKKGFNEVLKNFTKSKEARQKLAGKSSSEIIRHIYRNAFGREPDKAGMRFWSNVARTKSSNPAFLAAAITGGARGSDVNRLKMSAETTKRILSHTHATSKPTVSHHVSRPVHVAHRAPTVHHSVVHHPVIHHPVVHHVTHPTTRSVHKTSPVAHHPVIHHVAKPPTPKVSKTVSKASQGGTSMTVEQKVRNLYKALLGREPDPAGFKYWVNVAKTKGFNEVVKNFANSSEVRQKLSGKNTQEVIRHIYRNAFGREPDSAGMKFWFNVARTKSSNPAFLAAAITEGARGSDAERLKMPAAPARPSTLTPKATSSAYHKEAVAQPQKTVAVSTSSTESKLSEIFRKAVERALEQQRAAKPATSLTPVTEKAYTESMMPAVTSKASMENLMTYDQYLNRLKPATVEKPPAEAIAETFATYKEKEETTKQEKIKYALIAGLGLLTLAMMLNRR